MRPSGPVLLKATFRLKCQDDWHKSFFFIKWGRHSASVWYDVEIILCKSGKSYRMLSLKNAPFVEMLYFIKETWTCGKQLWKKIIGCDSMWKRKLDELCFLIMTHRFSSIVVGSGVYFPLNLWVTKDKHLTPNLFHHCCLTGYWCCAPE